MGGIKREGSSSNNNNGGEERGRTISAQGGRRLFIVQMRNRAVGAKSGKFQLKQRVSGQIPVENRSTGIVPVTEPVSRNWHRKCGQIPVVEPVCTENRFGSLTEGFRCQNRSSRNWGRNCFGARTGPTGFKTETGRQEKWSYENGDIFCIRTPFLMILGSLESQQQAIHYYA